MTSVLHILDHSIPLHSGYTFRTQAILKQQRNMGITTHHITSAKHSAHKQMMETVNDLTFHRTDKGALGNLPILNQWDVISGLKKRLLEVVAKTKPDILHAHSPVLNGYAALTVSQQLGIPLVYEVRAFWEDAAVDHQTTSEGSLRYRLTRALETHVFKNADGITCICKGLRRDIIDRGVDEAKLTIIPNAVNVEQFEFDQPPKQALLEKYGLQGKITLGFIGSFYAYEGLDLLIAALAKLRNDIPELRVLLIGGGPCDEILKEQTRSLGLEDRVIFTGRVPHEVIDDYYNLPDAMVYPRKAMRLTELVTPLKPLEAMAKGKLVVASDVGGHHELIEDRQTGFLFAADDTDALAETITEMLGKRDQWQAMKVNGRNFVERERNWKIATEPYTQVYERVLSARKADQ